MDEYTATTRAIAVTVQPFFLEDQSEPEEARFVWAYRVEIRNTGRETVQLMRRTWQITDETGHTLTVQGPGVVGDTPVLEPGEAYQYTSGTPLGTPSGFMTGQYHMIATATGEAFDVAIPAFSLDSPHGGGAVH